MSLFSCDLSGPCQRDLRFNFWCFYKSKMSNLEGNVEFSRLAYMICVCGILNEFKRSILWFLCFVCCWYLILDGPSSQYSTVHYNRERLTNRPLWLWCTATWSFMITVNSSCDHDVVLWRIFRRKKNYSNRVILIFG